MNRKDLFSPEKTLNYMFKIYTVHYISILNENYKFKSE